MKGSVWNWLLAGVVGVWVYVLVVVGIPVVIWSVETVLGIAL